MKQQALHNYVEESIHQFSDPVLVQEKANRFSRQAQRLDVENSKPKVMVLYDSRIPCPPDLVFGQDLGDVYGVQTILDQPVSPSLAASLEFGIDRYGCHVLVIALPEGDCGSATSKLRTLVEQIKSGSKELGRCLLSQELEVLGYTVDPSRRVVKSLPVSPSE